MTYLLNFVSFVLFWAAVLASAVLLNSAWDWAQGRLDRWRWARALARHRAAHAVKSEVRHG